MTPRSVRVAVALAGAVVCVVAVVAALLVLGIKPGGPGDGGATRDRALVVPQATVAPANGFKIAQADSLDAAAFRFGVSTSAILAANGLTDESQITPGMVLTIPQVSPTPQPTPATTSDSDNNPIGLHLSMPIAGACLTTDDDQMPNAPRHYRSGIHEGVDFFTGYACVDVVKDTPALAAADGVVIRADREYRPLTQAEIDDLEAKSNAQGFTDPGTLDKFRGRQVWIDHGNGIVTRYCHLDGIPRDIGVGSQVRRGDVVGYVGDSGTVESVSQPGYELHLHFEVRVGDSYLGAGLDPFATRAVYKAVFGIAG